MCSSPPSCLTGLPLCHNLLPQVALTFSFPGVKIKNTKNWKQTTTTTTTHQKARIFKTPEDISESILLVKQLKENKNFLPFPFLLRNKWESEWKE